MSGSLDNDRAEDAYATDVAPTTEEARAELERLFRDDRFKATDRRRAMLVYVVEETLAGRESGIKGVAIAQAVFGRGDDFDQQTDSIVRIEARRLRQDLDLYYLGPGRDNPIRIQIPKGRYLPQFTKSAQANSASDHLPVKPPLPWRNLGTFVPGGLRGATLAAIAVVGLAILTLSASIKANYEPSQTPSLVILPFAPVAQDTTTRNMASGFYFELIANLSRFPDFRLYTPNATRSSEAANATSTDYVLSGSIGVSESEVRLTAKLASGDTDQVIWGQTYSEVLSTRSLLDVQHALAGKIASVIAQPYGIVRNDVSMRELSSDVEPSLSGYSCVLRAYQYRRTFARDQFDAVRTCLSETIQTHPNYAEAWAMLGWIHLDEVRFRYVPEDEQNNTMANAVSAASQSVLINPGNIQGLKALSSINHYLGNYEEGWRLARKALEINPHDPDTLAQLGWRLAVRGDFDEGIPLLEKAIARTVKPPGWYYHLIAVEQYLDGDYASMLASAEIANTKSSLTSLSLVTIANAVNGNTRLAQVQLDELRTRYPVFFHRPDAHYRRHHATEEIIEALVDGLKQAGWKAPDKAEPVKGM